MAIEFSPEKKQIVCQKLQQYCDRELDWELGQFDAEFLFDFVAKEMGAYFYNQGLSDAQAVVRAKAEDMVDGIYEIEQPLP